jgi:hypothetical protein
MRLGGGGRERRPRETDVSSFMKRSLFSNLTGFDGFDLEISG